jgi:uncharacterized protein with GYD domain
MARYVSLLRFSDQGARAIRKSTRRAESFKRAARKAGVTIEQQLWTLGDHDGVLVLSADSHQKILHCLSELAAAGFVRTQTMPAFDAAEFNALVGR